jgi:hypothetical protein
MEGESHEQQASGWLASAARGERAEGPNEAKAGAAPNTSIAGNIPTGMAQYLTQKKPKIDKLRGNVETDHKGHKATAEGMGKARTS